MIIDISSPGALVLLVFAGMFLSGFAVNLIRKMIRNATTTYDNLNKWFLAFAFLLICLAMYLFTRAWYFLAAAPLFFVFFIVLKFTRRNK